MPFSPETIKNILSKCPICGLEEPCPLHSQKTADFREGTIESESEYDLAPEIAELLPQIKDELAQSIKDNVTNNHWASAGYRTASLVTLLKHFKQVHEAEDNNNKVIKSDIPPLPITKKY